jgi:hypothetical protein
MCSVVPSRRTTSVECSAKKDGEIMMVKGAWSLPPHGGVNPSVLYEPRGTLPDFRQRRRGLGIDGTRELVFWRRFRSTARYLDCVADDRGARGQRSRYGGVATG